MIVKIDKSFEKDAKKINSKSIYQKISAVINEFQVAEKLSEIKNLKKLKGSKYFYRVRMGDYRIGLIIMDKEVELIRILHRKDVYKYFP
ncbi:MAG: type II toxin-antitoxin system RelE/ParE family toxin [Ignavibacteriae bacterium]|nr:type II toxin-antitoxin system RelE/ParE family toxin [Ignavibacteriota bacterium]